MADFIVDEEEVDEHGAPVRHVHRPCICKRGFKWYVGICKCFTYVCRRKKPKKSRQRPGISSSALQEAHEIFGDVEDLLRLRKIDVRDRFGETSERSLEDQFDPSVLSEKYMTEKDDQIREVDIPERMQVYQVSCGIFVSILAKSLVFNTYLSL